MVRQVQLIVWPSYKTENCLLVEVSVTFAARGQSERLLPGDDQTVRIWDMDMFKAQQVICDQLERWGQITCIKWLSPTSDNGSVLCFGTGRGLILVYQTVAVSKVLLQFQSCNTFSGQLPRAFQHERISV